MYTGSCLCGRITFSAKAFLPPMAHCHCIDCRKFHGAAFSTFGEVLVNDFHWLTGKQYLSTFVAENHSRRQFCSICGSSLTFQASSQKEAIEVSIACLDNAESLHPDAHVFVDSKVDWLCISDDLPQHYRHRNG